MQECYLKKRCKLEPKLHLGHIKLTCKTSWEKPVRGREATQTFSAPDGNKAHLMTAAASGAGKRVA